nr:hypothetical protein [Tanacetum cinerariifolium]
NENDHFNAESNLIEALLNKDNFLLNGEFALINPIPPGIAETNFDPKENIRLIKKLLYDNSSHRPPEGLNSENDFEKENSGCTTIHTYISLVEYESFYDESDSASEIFNDDLAHIISLSEYEYVYADDESDSGDLTTKVVDDISVNSTRELYVHVPNVLTTLYPVFDILLPLSSENKDKVFNLGILISKEEKSPHLLSHRGLTLKHGGSSQALSEFEDLSDYVSECDLPFCNNSPNFNNDFEIFSNPLFDSKDDYTSSDDESSSEEDVLVLEDLNPILPGNENDHFNAESNLIEALLNKDTMITSPKIDFLLKEFAGEFALINPIPPGIAETNFDPKENIRLIKKLLYDNSSHRPPEGLNSENDFEKENSGCTTIHTYISLVEYESFYDESDSASEIFNDDLAHIISLSEYE